jgi:hypothetical protein
MHTVLQLLHLEYQQKLKVFQILDFYTFHKNPANLAADHGNVTTMPT